LETIEAVGPGGHYLSQRHTGQRLKDDRWPPKITSRVSLEEWKKDKLDACQRARSQALKLLNTHQPEPPGKEAERELARLVTEAERSLRGASW